MSKTIVETVAARIVNGKIEIEGNTTAEGKMIQIPAGDIQIQPRTLLITKPGFYYAEPTPAKRKADKGNDHNQITHGLHQADPNRNVSCCAIMPDILRARETGNAYPADYAAADEKCVTTKAYQHTVALAHKIHAALTKAGDTGMTIADAKAIAATFPEGRANYNGKAARDVLRDLRAYGLAKSDSAAYGDAVRFYAVKPADVPTFAEVSEAAKREAAKAAKAAKAAAKPAKTDAKAAKAAKPASAPAKTDAKPAASK